MPTQEEITEALRVIDYYGSGFGEDNELPNPSDVLEQVQEAAEVVARAYRDMVIRNPAAPI